MITAIRDTRNKLNQIVVNLCDSRCGFFLSSSLDGGAIHHSRTQLFLGCFPFPRSCFAVPVLEKNFLMCGLQLLHSSLCVSITDADITFVARQSWYSLAGPLKGQFVSSIGRARCGAVSRGNPAASLEKTNHEIQLFRSSQGDRVTSKFTNRPENYSRPRRLCSIAVRT